MIARWPGRVKGGTTSDFAWAFWDFLPTAAELAGASPPKGIDGISVLPAILGRSQAPHEYLYWEAYEKGYQQAVRMGDWKGVRPRPGGPIELYNLKQDIGEKNNLAASQPEVVQRIEKAMAAAHVDSPQYSIRSRPGRG